jgi:hypothetical protein
MKCPCYKIILRSEVRIVVNISQTEIGIRMTKVALWLALPVRRTPPESRSGRTSWGFNLIALPQASAVYATTSESTSSSFSFLLGTPLIDLLRKFVGINRDSATELRVAHGTSKNIVSKANNHYQKQDFFETWRNM